MRTFNTVGLLAAALLLASVPAAAQDAACCQLTTSLAHDVTRGSDLEGDERFFVTEGAPPNIHFLVDNSGSMNELAVHAAMVAEINAEGNNARGCVNDTINDLLLASGWNQTPATRATDARYNPPDTGTGYGSDSGFNNLFRRNRYYAYQAWRDDNDRAKHDNPPVLRNSGGDYTNADAVCRNTFGLTGNSTSQTTARNECISCLDTKGYYIAKKSSGATNFSLTELAASGEFLNLNPPKYVTMRIVLKDVIKNLRRMRAGYSIFEDGTNPNGGILRQPQNPSCSQALSSTSAFDNNRASYINDINSIHFKTNTPLAETLLNIGQYFSSSDSIYTTKWDLDKYGGTYTKSAFRNGSLNSQNRSFCWGCQETNIIILTDGEPTADASIPRDRLVELNGGKVLCPDENGDGVRDCPDNNDYWLDDVAKFLHTRDLQENTPAIVGDLNTAGQQSLNIYAVAFGLRSAVLKNATVVGGKDDGSWYYEADDQESLQNAIGSILSNIETRATSFSAASVASFQINRSGGSLLPRFRPDSTLDSPREGFLYRFDVGSEDVLGCDPAQAATLLSGGAGDPNDLNRDGDCEDVNLIDSAGRATIEDSDGRFVLSSDPTTPATPFWEAGAVMKTMGSVAGEAWKARKIYTIIDANGDGKLDASDTPIEFSAGPAPLVDNAALLRPYLGIPNDATYCGDIALRLGISTTVPPAAPAMDPTECARIIIRWYRGADSLNPDPARRLKDRRFLLHDIFHSAPVSVDAPISKLFCGLTNQCVQTMFDPDENTGGTPLQRYTSAGVELDAYDEYVRQRGKRSKIVLVGSNGGMLHAFHNGTYTGNDAATGLPVHDNGTGRELWAFVPPDQLPKMKRNAGRHGYFVDSSPMVREVWVDGSGGELKDGKKQRNEFRTVAITGSGVGGVHRFALDLTELLGTSDATLRAPTNRGDFLWMWPQPCDAEALLVGESTTNFSPKPPPIGPVTIKDPNGPISVNSIKAREQWIVFMNGGHDKYLNRGRLLSMLDVWTGKSLWDFKFNDGTPNSDKLMFPISAGVGMVDMGSGEGTTTDWDNFFDTAVVGDYGGQVWTVRFWEPGEINAATGKVTNWYAARSLQTTATGKDAGDHADATAANSGTYAEPFTQVASLILDDYGSVRAYLGTGDRYNLTDNGGPHCRLSNLRGCIAQGCNLGPVTMTTIRNGTTLGALTNDPVAFKYGTSTQTATSSTSSCNSFSSSLSWTVAASGACTTSMLTDSGGAIPQVRYGCVGGVCTFEDDWSKIDGKLATAPENTARFYAFVAFAGTGRAGGSRHFRTAAEAVAYDSLRLDDRDLVDVTDTVATATGSVTGNSSDLDRNGWMLRFGVGDERTGSGTSVVDGCVLWNTFQPGDVIGPVCSNTGTNTARFYQGHAVTGIGNCAQSFVDPATGNPVRSISRSVVAVPGDPSPQLMISSGYAATGVITLEAGNTQGNTVGENKELVQSLYQLTVDPEEHRCRHEGVDCK